MTYTWKRKLQIYVPKTFIKTAPALFNSVYSESRDILKVDTHTLNLFN